MTVVSTEKDTEALTLTIVAELAAPPERAWQLFADPRQLERWWGPPTWPATFYEHDFTVEGRAAYYMTGPDGEKAGGWWRFLGIDEPRSLSFEDGFADTDGQPVDSMPTTRARVELQEIPTGTRMTIVSFFRSSAELEQLAQMGMVEGMTAAMGQIDGILAEG
ncbi:activator of HSP90 ATPase [Paraoerskovia sediminicola]|uniref:Activator of HSP90 ATPase n=1 Tax=Paraoerskovia sediminicola TaxID=1138587 RepID=A0ABN6XEB5_9CELL|nr:SRPBCC domain-containing protein [Paraoerskovia sediminicola]BDZ43196.1 activator of HSP90 ATPase [Paraoerskovia sediminicola]